MMNRLADTLNFQALGLRGIGPRATRRVAVEMNLDSRVSPSAPAAPAPAIDFADAGTYNNAMSLAVYDAKGQDVALTCYFQKACTDTWNVFVTVNGVPAETDALGDPVATTRLQFRADGGRPLVPAGPVAFDTPASVNSLGAQTLAIAGVMLDLSGATQYAAGFGVTDLSQDGHAPGEIPGLGIEGNGAERARGSDDRYFRNPQGLQPMTANAWSRTRLME